MPYKPSRREVVLAAAATAAACGGPEMPPTIPGPRAASAIPQARPLPAYVNNPTYHQQPSSSPIHLSGSVLLQSGANGAPPIAAYKNPTGQDMEILEIKFEVSGPIGTTGDVQQFGSTIACQLVYGTEQLTNGAVPVWCFGRQENPPAEDKYDQQYTTVFSSYSWRLPRPLYVPAGAVIVPSLTHNGLVSSALNVRVGYSGRTIFKKPKSVFLPWVACYTSKAFAPVYAAGSDQSSELDLVNPFDQPLNLQRFVGRFLAVNGAGALNSDTSNFSIPSQYLQMRMNDSYGRAIVRSYTPFFSVISPLTHSWELDNGTKLDPNAYYRVFLNKLASTQQSLSGGDPTGTLSVQFQAFVSMVGWRKVVSS